MNSIQIDCFLAAAAAESFSAAAETLYMTQPTFGRHISSLERELGFPLFLRGWKNCRLTAAGAIMYQGFSRMTEEYNQLLSQAGEAASGKTGRLTVGLLEGQLIDGALQDILRQFQAAYPGITLELERYTFRSMLNELSSHALDIGITLSIEARNRPELDYLPLYSLRNELVVSAKHPLARQRGLSLSDFSGETFVEIEKEDSEIISVLMAQSCREAGFEPKTLKTPDLKTQILSVELGLGIAAFNEYHQTYHHPGLVHIPLPELPRAEFCAAWRKDAANPAVTLFLDTLQTIQSAGGQG